MFLTTTINLPWQSRAAFSLNAASGQPYNITTGRDNNGDGGFNDRPGVVAATQPRAIPTLFGALDPAAVNGTLRRNAGNNPATATLDLNLSRTFAFGKLSAAGDRPFKLAMNVRASNLLNRANLLGVNGKILGCNRLSFSIFHMTFVICHCAPRAVPAMTNDKRHMENGKWKNLKIFA